MFFLGGFKGEVRWPEGPPHLALGPKPSYLFLGRGGHFILSFLCFLIPKKLLFPLKKGIVCLFSSLSLFFCFGLPLFNVSFSVSRLFFFCFFLLVFLFCFLLVPYFCFLFPFVCSLFLFHERKAIKTFNCNFSSIFLFLGFPVFPFFLCLFFP